MYCGQYYYSVFTIALILWRIQPCALSFPNINWSNAPNGNEIKSITTNITNTIRTGLCTDGDKQRVVYAPNRTCLHATGPTGWQTINKNTMWFIDYGINQISAIDNCKYTIRWFNFWLN